ncbi:MAG TPA: hypothetical protein VG756_01855 [Pseudonocardiaceae bacterium]|jgi:hypothetical protein|nr:hypothetical protein [Pseudonocardiaceae bacterium]
MPDSLPESEAPLLVRTDFTHGRAWLAVQDELDVVWDLADDSVTFVDEPEYTGLTAAQLIALVPDGPHPVLLVADEVTFAGEDHPVLVVDLRDQPGRTFRAETAAVNSVIEVLSSADQSFTDYLDHLDDTGVYRARGKHFQAMDTRHINRSDSRARVRGSIRPAYGPQPGHHAQPGAPATRRIPGVPARRADTPPD